MWGWIRKDRDEPPERAYSPHCDSAVLHAPGECHYCDLYPEWQYYRQVARIAFTGQEPDEFQTMCPSEMQRPIETIERWYGNRREPRQ